MRLDSSLLQDFQTPGTSGEGLTRDEVEARRVRFGRNVIPEQPPRRFLQLFLARLRDLMVIVLIIAGTIAAFVGEPADVAAIVGFKATRFDFPTGRRG